MLVCLTAVPASGRAEALDLACDGGEIRWELKDVLLGTLIGELERECGVRMTGLDLRRQEAVSLSVAAPTLIDAIKMLLTYLQIDNYAFEFSDQTLRCVTVFPGIQTPERRSLHEPEPAEPVVKTAPRIVAVVPGTQAAGLDLQPDDFILAYDGTPVYTAGELAALVKQKDPQTPVEMEIMRGRTSFRVYLSGGFIGVRIQTAALPADGF